MQLELADWILDQTTDALVYCDAEGVIARWNAAAEALFGFKRAEAIGASLDIIVPEPLRAAHWEGFRRAVAQGRTRLGGRPTRTRAVHRNGARLLLDMSFALVRDPAGAVVGAVAIARIAADRSSG